MCQVKRDTFISRLFEFLLIYDEKSVAYQLLSHGAQLAAHNIEQRIAKRKSGNIDVQQGGSQWTGIKFPGNGSK